MYHKEGHEIIPAAALQIGIGVAGADMATSALELVTGAFTGAAASAVGYAQSATMAYAAVEKLQESYKAIIFQEMQRIGVAKSKAAADALSVEKARELYAISQEMAILSPFNLDDIAEANKIAASFGFLVSQYDTVKEAQDAGVLSTQRVTQAMLDFAASTGMPAYEIPNLVVVMGQIKAVGKAQGEDMLQLKERGINVTNILKDAWGKTNNEIMEMQENGQLLADKVLPEIVGWIEKMYGGGAASQGGTMSGLLASIEELQTAAQVTFFAPAIETVKPYVQSVVDALQSAEVLYAIKDWSLAFDDLVATAIDRMILFGSAALRLGNALLFSIDILESLPQNAILAIIAAITTLNIVALEAGKSLGALYAAVATHPILAATTVIAGLAMVYKDWWTEMQSAARVSLGLRENWTDANTTESLANQRLIDYASGLKESERLQQKNAEAIKLTEEQLRDLSLTEEERLVLMEKLTQQQSDYNFEVEKAQKLEIYAKHIKDLENEQEYWRRVSEANETALHKRRQDAAEQHAIALVGIDLARAEAIYQALMGCHTN